MKKSFLSCCLAFSLIISLFVVPTASANTTTINLGDYIQMGEYYGQPILWRCVSFEKISGYDENGNPIIDSTDTRTSYADGYLPLMLSDKIICIKAFDAKGKNTIGSHGRGYYSGYHRMYNGSNYWADSNIRDWLNSTASEGNIVWSCGNPPTTANVMDGYNPYDNEAGFLTHFSSTELTSIETVTQKSLLDQYEYSWHDNYYTGQNDSIITVVQNYDTAYSELVTDTMFFLDVKQINTVYNNGSILGKEYFGGVPTAEAVENSDYKNNKWVTWLRSPNATTYAGSYYIKTVNVDKDAYGGGVVYQANAYYGLGGVRPAFFLNTSTASFVSGIGTGSNPYIVSGRSGNNFSNSTSTSAPVIKSTNLHNDGKSYDIIKQTFSVDKGNPILCNIELDIDWKDITKENQEVYLTQGTSNQNNSPFIQYNKQTNTFENVPLCTAFEANKPIYIIAVDKSNPKNKSTSVATKINIIGTDGDAVYNSGALIDGKNFKFGRDIEINIPENVPVFGGTQLTWKIDFIPITVKAEDGKMNVVFGLDLDEDGKFSFDEYKNSFNNYVKNLDKKNRKQNRTLKQLRNDLRMSEANKRKNKGMTMSMWGNKVLKNSSSGEADTGLDIMGYAIAEKGKNGWELKDGYICFEATISYTYKGQVFIYVIPCYYSFKGTLNGKASAQVKDLDFRVFEPKFQTLLEAGVSAEITGGIGVPLVAGFDATGKGSLNIKMDINNFEKDVEEYLKVYVDASAAFGLTLFGQKVATKEVWHLNADNGIIYSTYPEDYDKSWIKPKRASLMSFGGIYDGYSADNVYEPESRDYLENGQSWNMNRRRIMLMSAGYSNKTLKTLAENVYPNAKPQICNIDGTKVLIFTTDNAERTAQNKQMLVYSVYNEDTESWSVPNAVCDDETADFYPQIAGEYLVWQNQKSVMGDNLTLADIGSQGEIVIAKWNGNGFDSPTALTNNNDLDTLPRIAVNGDEISVVWIKNSANDILGIDGESSLIKRTYNGSTWGNEQQVKSGLNAIAELDIGYDSNNLYIAYIPDSDGDISTVDDREIYIIGNSETQITDNEVLDSNVVINNGKLYWYSESNINYKNLSENDISTVFSEGKHKLAEGFTVSENNGNTAILWSATNDDEENDGTEIKGVLYQNGEWGDIVDVSDVGGYAKYPTCILEDDGKILSAFTSKQDDVTNLYTLGLYPSYDISIEDVFFDESKIAPNSENEFEITIKNSGELPIDSFSVNVYNEDSTLNNTVAFEDEIKAGETKTFIASFITGAEIAFETLSIEATLDDGEEYVTDNNSVELEIGHSDVAIEEIKNYEILPTSVATIIIKNKGYSDAENVVIELRQDSIDGEIIDTEEIEILSANETAEVTFEYNPKDYENTNWFVNVITDSEEMSLGNNSDYFVNECAVGLSDIEHEILNCSYNGNILNVNTFAKNSTDSTMTGTAYAAVYSEQDKLKGISMQRIDVKSYSDTGIDIWIDNYSYANGDYVKAFIWSDSLKPLCIVKSANLNENPPE